MKKLLLSILLVFSAYAQECQQSNELSTAGTSGSTIDNRNRGCQLWNLVYWVEGFSALTIRLEYSIDNSTWTATTLSLTDVPVGKGNVRIYAPYFRVALTAATGTGKVKYIVGGYKGSYGLTDIVAGGGGGGGGITTLASQTGVTQTITRGIGIAGTSATDDHSFSLDLAELVANQIIFDGSQASRTLSFSLSGATDPVVTLSDGAFNLSTGTLQQAGTAVVLQSRTVSTTSPLGGGGALSGDLTLTCTNCATAAGTLSSNLPLIGGGGKAVATGTTSGNTTEFGTITGTKTANKQLAFDVSGNIIASATDIGGVGSGDNALEVSVAASTATIAAGVASKYGTGQFQNPTAISSATVVESSAGSGTIRYAVNANSGTPALFARVETALTLGEFACTGITCTSHNDWQDGDFPLATTALATGTMGAAVDLRPKATFWKPVSYGNGLAESAGVLSVTAALIGVSEVRTGHSLIFGAAAALQTTDDLLNYWYNGFATSITITSVTCKTDTGSITIQLQKNDGAAVDMLSSDLTCTTSGATTTSFVSGENDLATTDWMDFLIETVASGTPTNVALNFRYTVAQ